MATDIVDMAHLCDRTCIEDAAIDIAILVDDKYRGSYDYVKECVLAIMGSMYANVYTCQTQDIVV